MADKVSRAGNLTTGDIQQGRDLIASAIPILARLVGLGQVQARSLEKIVLAEFDTFVAAPLKEGRHPDLLQGAKLAAAIGVDRRTLDAKYRTLGPALQRCAMAFAMLLSARGDFLESTVCLAEETSSPVGEKASGDGISERIPEGKRTQRLSGLMLSGIDTHAHMTLAPSLRAATAVTYTEEIVSGLQMLTTVSRLLQKLGDDVERTGRGSEMLEQFEVSPGQLRGYVPPSDLLVPRLSVGRETDVPGKFEGLSPNVDRLRRQLNATPQGGGVRRAVIEVPTQPFAGAQRKLTASEVRAILSWLVRRVALDWRTRSADIRYGLEQRGELLLLHRKVLRDDDNVETMLGLKSTLVLLGFRTRPVQKVLDEDLAYAIVGAELLATRTRAHRAAVRLGEDLAPGLTQVKTDDARAFVRSLRLISNTALTVVSERRKREEAEAEDE
jgi:hypothetical protein